MIETLEESGQTFVLLPHVIDWNTPPTWSRRWKPDKASAITGHEDRVDLGSAGFVSLSFKLDPIDLEERAAMVARILEAKKSGLAACPYWGRAGKIINGASNTTLNLEPTRWNWAAGDRLFIRSTARTDYLEWDTATVESYDPATWTIILEETLSRNYPRGTLLWPILFGNFESDALAATSDHHGSISIRITQRRPWPTTFEIPDLCAILGIENGGGDNFDCYDNASPVTQSLTGGNIFDGPWILANSPFGLISLDPFEAYIEGPADTLNHGTQWDGPWILANGL